MNSSSRRRGTFLWVALRAAAFSATLVGTLHAHPFVSQAYRAGACPAHDGNGWIGEAFLNIPESSATELRTADSYVMGRTPDFTFRTPLIDFPAGPTSFRLDRDFDTVGDFLNAYIYDVSDPAKLDEPFGNLYLRFTGLVKVVLADETRIRGELALPVWVDFGSMGYDGYRTTVGVETCYRTINANFTDPWYNFGPGCEVLGLYPIEVTYFNHYDPDNSLGAPYAGIELYSWHGSEYDLPAGKQMTHAVRGPGTLVPPRVIYQPGDELPVVKGDFDADADVDLRDFQWLQNCFGGAVALAAGCDGFDFEDDVDVDGTDFQAFQESIAGP